MNASNYISITFCYIVCLLGIRFNLFSLNHSDCWNLGKGSVQRNPWGKVKPCVLIMDPIWKVKGMFWAPGASCVQFLRPNFSGILEWTLHWVAQLPQLGKWGQVWRGLFLCRKQMEPWQHVQKLFFLQNQMFCILFQIISDRGQLYKCCMLK